MGYRRWAIGDGRWAMRRGGASERGTIDGLDRLDGLEGAEGL